MRVELLDQYSSDNPDEAAAFAARTCYEEDSPVEMSFDDTIRRVRMPDEKDVYTLQEQHRHLLKQLIRRGHFSVFEHPKAVFAIEGVSRATMAQITRHRHLSFSVQSQRYVSFDDAEMYVPDSIEENEVGDVTRHSQIKAVNQYRTLIDEGVPEEDARMVLPIGTKVNMIISGNLRAWMHVIDMRHAGDAQGEIRELSGEILRQLRDWAPISVELYEDYAKGSSKKAP